MLKLLPLLLIALTAPVVQQCNKKRPEPPRPPASPSPSVTPTPTPTPTALPTIEPTVTPTPVTPESANKTSVPPEPQIIDAAGDLWTLLPSGWQVLKNGAETGGIGTWLVYCNRIVYAFGTDSNWWQWTGSSWSHFGLTNPCVITPAPSPGASPTPTPTPPITGRPQPYPTPVIDLQPYLHEQGGKVVDITIQPGEDVGLILNRVDAGIDGPGKIILRGSGDIRTQIVTSHDVDAIGGEYRCETNTLEGCWLARDDTKIEASRGATIYGPTVFDGSAAITVFQTYASAKNNYASVRAVTIKGWRIIGRQTRTDGGVRQVISFGNCVGCAAIENVLEWSPSIGIQSGGGAAEGNHAVDNLIYRNKLTGFAAAAIAGVNVRGFVVTENDIRNPGRVKGEPGGISGVDIESNNVDDCVKDIKIFNNYIGYGTAPSQSIGNGILGQNVYGTPCSGGLLIANNVIDGWEGRNGLEASNFWGLSGGLYFVGRWDGGLVVSNVVIRALQPAVSFYGVRGLTIQDTWLISSGGGGAGAVMFSGSIGNTLERVRIFDDPNIKPGSTGWWIECDESSGVNVFKDMMMEGKILCKQ